MINAYAVSKVKGRFQCIEYDPVRAGKARYRVVLENDLAGK